MEKLNWEENKGLRGNCNICSHSLIEKVTFERGKSSRCWDPDTEVDLESLGNNKKANVAEQNERKSKRCSYRAEGGSTASTGPG